MAERTDTLVAAQYFLAVQGMAMMRNVLTAPTSTRPRVDELRGILDQLDEFPHSLEIPMIEHDFDSGYTRWSETYDGPRNPAIEAEQPIVDELLDGLATGTALDAACGTGRHAARLADRGHDVIGIDANEAMLAVARAKVPAGDFRLGRLEALPVDDRSIDLVTCALALTHVDTLAPVMAELARVMRPGAVAVLSDIHPFNTMFGGIAGFPGADITQGIPYVLNLTHHVSEYVTAFVDAGLTITACIEPRVTEDMLGVFPSHPFFPDATREAYLDTPYLLIWRLERS